MTLPSLLNKPGRVLACAVPGARPVSPPFPRPFLTTLCISLLSSCLGEAGAFLAKSLLPIRFMYFFTTIRVCSHMP